MTAIIKPDVSQLKVYQLEYDLLPLHHYLHKDMEGRERGKSPIDKDWRQKHYTFDQVVDHVKKHGRNAGVLLSASQLVVDVDPRNMEKGKTLEAFCKLVGLDPTKCPTVKTGSGGFHLYLRKPTGVKLVDSLKDFPGIEFKSLGRQVVSAGSVHPNGKRYSWDTKRPAPGDEPDAPTKLILLAARPDRVIDTDAGELSPETLAKNLEQLNAEDYKDHNEWFTLMQACHYATAGEGRQEFVDWSTSDPEFHDHGTIIGRRWDSLHTEKSERPVTEKTLYKEILKHDGEIVYASAEEDFPEDEVSIQAKEDEAKNPSKRKQDKDHATKTKAEWDKAPDMPRSSVKLMADLNKHYWVIDSNGSTAIMREKRTQDERLENRTRIQPVYYSFMDFCRLHNNRTVTTTKLNAKGESVDSEELMGDAWVKWHGRRTYYDLICDPSPNRVDNPEVYNMFKGWGVEPIKGDWSIMRDHLKNVICSGNEGHFEYFLKWLAMMFQKPHVLPKVAILMQGGKGSGKSIVGDAILALVGQHGQYTSNSKHVTGQFNSHLQDAIFLFADEAYSSGKEAEADLKSLITQETRMYEAKYKTPSIGRNLIHMLMASNLEWAVHATSDERRYAIFKVSDEKANDKPYFKALWKQLTKKGGLEAMLYELMMEIDVEDWDPTTAIPQTEGLATVKLYSMNAFELWWYDVLEQGSFNGDLLSADWETDQLVIPLERMVELYGDFKRQVNRAGPAPVGNMLSIALGKLIEDGEIHRNVRRRPPDDYPHIIKVNSQGLVPCVGIPKLSRCRETFDRLFSTSLGEDNE